MYSCPCEELTKDTGNQCERCTALRTLDLPDEPTDREIENAHRTFAKVWHPDRFEHDEKLKRAAEEKMRAINAAFDFLTSEDGKNAAQPHEQAAAAEPTQTESRPTRTFPNRLQLFWRALPRPTLLMATAALVAGLCTMGFLAKKIDSFLMGEPVVGEQYSNLKTFVAVKFREEAQSAWNHSGSGLRSLIPGKNTQVDAASRQPEAVAQENRAEPEAHVAKAHEASAPAVEHVKALPYITAGLSKAEVMAIQGVPTTASESKLTYGKSEFDFSDDKLDGWKIDQASDPAHVKLWPEDTADQKLQGFMMGSTKDQVLAVQGTPTLFSDDTFGYGGSEVYFQNDRVIGWKNDLTSVPLHITSQ